jgi:hypothetical protein
MAEMYTCMYVCFIIVLLPSSGCEALYQILTHSGGAQECIGVHAIQGQDSDYMFATLSTRKLPNSVLICCDFLT